MAPKNPSPPASTTPRTPLNGSTPGPAAPTQTSGSETTLFLDIDLNNGAPPMTAVYLPGPLPSGPLDLLVYFHGWKQGDLDGMHLNGMSVDQFLTVPTFDFRKMIQGTTKRKFAMVIPTLGDYAGSGDLAKTGANIDLYLDMVLKGIGKHLPAATATPAPGNGKPLPAANATPALGNLVLGAHSGGGDTMFNFASRATTGGGSGAGTRGKIRELWCFDCTYSHGNDWLPMLPDYTGPGGPKNQLPGLVKLWVVSTGMSPASKKVRPDMKKKADPVTNPETEKHYDSGTGDNAHAILTYAQRNAKAGKATTTEVSVYHSGLTHWDKTKNTGAADVNYTGYTHPSGHNQSVGENLPALVTKSTILK